MKHLKNTMLILAGVLLLLSACVKDELDVNESTIFPESQALVQTTLFGTVLDENDEPIQNATVFYRSGRSAESVSTDEFGNFLIEDVTNEGESAFLQVKRSGKFDAFRRFGVLEGRHNRTVIKMQDKTIAGQVTASDGGRVVDANGAFVDLPPNAIVDADGQPYSGTVDVAMAWIDPSAEDLPEIMVGDLSGLDLEGNRAALTTFGMLQVELLDPSGNELNLDEGQQAQLGFPVPVSMQGTAKETAPLWIYDEDLGTWVEENTATYENGQYVGRVPHFSSFNIDFKGDVIEITGQVKWESATDTLNGSYLKIFVCSEQFGNRGGWLCDDGSFKFYNFPKDVPFTLKVIDACGQTLYEEELGPFAESTDLGDILVGFGINNVSFIGTAVNCDGAPVTEGLVQVTSEDRVIRFPVENGAFNFSVDLCEGSEGELIVYDTEAQLQSDVITVDNSVNTVDLGEIELCDEIEEFLEFRIQGEDPVFLSPDVTYKEILDGQMVFARIEYSGQNSPDSTGLGGSLSMGLDSIPPTPSTMVRVLCSEFNYLDPINRKYYFSRREITIDFEEFDSDVGGRMKGSFEGMVNIEGGASDLPIEGSFDFTVK